VESHVTFWLAIVFVTINGAVMISWAAAQGFKLKPTALAFFAGAIGNALSGSVTPISGQSSILTVTDRIKDINVRVGALLIAAAVMIPLGMSGAISTIHTWTGPAVMQGMLAGVGIMLVMICFNMTMGNMRTGVLSMITALFTWMVFNPGGIFPNPNALVYVIAVSVGITAFDFAVIQKKRIDILQMAKDNGFVGDMQQNESYKFWTREFWSDFKLIKPKVGLMTLYFAAAFICVNIGTNFAFGSITGGMAYSAHGITQNFDHLTIINSAADIPAALFGGAPIEAIISATALTQWPVLAGILVMVILGIMCLIGVMTKIVKFVPPASLAGFLLVIGLFSTFVPNMTRAMNAGSGEAAVAMCVTAISKNPFLGLIAGVLVRYIGGLFGLV
jgi:AGZA family xanthine/uracil permease-like MFS transporter